MILHLNAMERLVLFDIVPPQGRMRDVVTYAKLRMRLVLSEEEESEAQVVRKPVGEGQISVDCQNPTMRWDIEFAEHEMDVLIRLAKEYERWPSSADSINLISQLEEVTSQPFMTEA